MANTFIHLPPTGSITGPIDVNVTANTDNIETRPQALATKVDDTTTANVTYVGEAVVGTSAASSLWRIKKIDETSGIVITWADGDSNFDNNWNNRASLTYL